MNYTKLFFSLILQLIFGPCITNAQSSLSGQVKDPSGQGIIKATVAIVDSAGLIKKYSLTDENGRFQFEKIEVKEIRLKISHVSYTTLDTILNINGKSLSIFLVPNLKSLNEIIVRQSPIYYKEDTLNYNPSSLAGSTDKVLADVLKKIPGIQIATNGKVYFQGKEISNLLVDGMNLMEGRYNLLTNSLPSNMVSRIQIIENDQRLKVLKKYLSSDAVTMNIRLKKGFTTTLLNAGAGEGGYNLGAVPMYFSKKYQILGRLQHNTSGENYDDLLINHLKIEDDQKYKETIYEIPKISVATSDLSSARIPKNKSSLGSLNILKKLGENGIFRFNIHFLNAEETSSDSARWTILNEGRSNILREVRIPNINKRLLLSSLLFEKNSANLFLKNELTFLSQQDNANISGLLSMKIFNQEIFKRKHRVHNNLLINIDLGNSVLSFTSVIQHHNNPQKLMANPGPFDSLINKGQPYNYALQDLNIDYAYLNNSASLIKKIKKMSLRFTLGNIFLTRLLILF